MAASKLTVSNLALSLIGAARITTFGETTTEEGRVINAVYDDVRDMVLCEHPWGFAQKRVTLIDMTRTEQDDWGTGTAYVVDDIVYDPTLTKYYKCLIAHTASTLFATDLASVYWELYTSWVTATVYAKGDKVYNSGVEYSCLSNHTSGTFATDLSSVYWVATEKIDMSDDGIEYVYYLPTDFLHLSYTNNEDAQIKVEGQRLLSDSDGLKIVYTYQNDTPSYYTPSFRMALAVRLAAEICFNITNAANKAQVLVDKYENIDLPKAMSLDSNQETPRSVRQDEWEDAREGGTGIKGKSNDATWHPEA